MKLSETALRYLQAFPADEERNGQVHHGVIYRGQGPKHTSILTVRKLYLQGLIAHAHVDFYSCPMQLTEKGRRFLQAPN